MARIDTLGNYLTDVAEAIREKKGTTETIEASKFDEEIKNLPSGGSDWGEYISDTINVKSTDGYYFQNHFVKKFPVFKVEGTYLGHAFHGYSGSLAPQLENTSSVTNWSYCFYLTYIKEFPAYDTSGGENFLMAFHSSALEKIPLLDLGNAKNISNIINNFNNKLTDIGGFKDLGKSYSTSQSENYSNYTFNILNCPNVTHESLLNILNNLYDIASIGVKPQTLQLGSTNLSKLTEEEIAIATNKGWNVS